MATLAVMCEADSLTRKRSLILDYLSNCHTPPPKRTDLSIPHSSPTTPSPRPSSHLRQLSSLHRQQRSLVKVGRRHSNHRASMQAHFTMRQHPSSIPSFMSVYQDDARQSTIEQAQQQQQQHDLTNAQSELTVNSPMQSTFSSISRPFHIFHQPRNSTSTSASESPDSSPTTTVSTGDSSSVAESSPSTSPETPISSNISPLCSMMDEQKFQPPERIRINPIQGTFFEMQRPTTPGKKPRNLKGLAVNTIPAGRPLGRAVSYNTPSVDQQNASGLAGISSPVFVKPPTPPRRKMSSLGLSIMTPANNNAALPRIAIPPTPSMTRPNMLSLRNYQSSPALATFPADSPASPQRSSVSAQRAKAMGFADVVHEEDEEDEPNFDIPQSQEEKPESYPQGPIKIYESGIDLYYEPAANVASCYDVIFNVASEVRNPFREADAVQPTPALNKEMDIVAVPYHSTSPDTPKATLLNSIAAGLASKEPEYIHIPWEHNTDIVRDLCILVKIMDEKIQQGKRILVHCQCGVSRSASLIVAYGLYKNPELSVQDAYDAVKKRSKWIAPNMSLIMQLQEFRTKVSRSTAIDQDTGCTDEYTGQSAAVNDILSPIKTTSGDALPFMAPTSFFPLQPSVTAPATEFARDSTPVLQPLTIKPAPREQKPFTRALPFRRDWNTSPKKADFDFSSPSPLLVETPSREDSVTPQAIAIAAPPMAVAALTEITNHNVEMAPIMKPITPPRKTDFQVPAKRKTPNFSRQLPLRRDWSVPEDESSMASKHTFLELTPQDGFLSPRSETFHMTPVAPLLNGAAEVSDSFGILSPIRTEFSSNQVNPFLPSLSIERHSPQPLALASPPLPRQLPDTTPLATSLARNIPGPINLNSIPIPTAESAPNFSTLKLPRRLNSKYSAPNLQQQLRLRKMQFSLENSIQQTQATNSQPRAFDDLDALMSPRATEFTVNPWNTVKFGSEASGFTEIDAQSGMSSSQETIVPVTASPAAPIEISKEDPRSPALHGVAPIVRNIDEVL